MWTFVDVDLCQCGPSLMWTFVDVDLHRCGPLSMWTFVDVDICQLITIGGHWSTVNKLVDFFWQFSTTNMGLFQH